jgi:multicomponent Na+:H+ antiporter subunit E
MIQAQGRVGPLLCSVGELEVDFEVPAHYPSRACMADWQLVRIHLMSSRFSPFPGRDRLVLFATLMLFWVMLMGSLKMDVLLVGALASAVISLWFSSGLSFFTEFRMSRAALVAGVRYYGYFFQELVKANLKVAAIVISPNLPIDPAIVKVRTRLKSRMGRLMLANSITLTPGTLTVEITGEWLYVHWVQMEAEDIETATASIVAGYERYLEVMYG